jgi:cysteine desulfurase
VEASHVLSAIGLSNAQARSSIRFSLGRMTASEDIDYTLEVLPAVVERLRAVSPHYKTAGTSIK